MFSFPIYKCRGFAFLLSVTSLIFLLCWRSNLTLNTLQSVSGISADKSDPEPCCLTILKTPHQKKYFSNSASTGAVTSYSVFKNAFLSSTGQSSITSPVCLMNIKCKECLMQFSNQPTSRFASDALALYQMVAPLFFILSLQIGKKRLQYQFHITELSLHAAVWGDGSMLHKHISFHSRTWLQMSITVHLKHE